MLKNVKLFAGTRFAESEGLFDWRLKCYLKFYSPPLSWNYSWVTWIKVTNFLWIWPFFLRIGRASIFEEYAFKYTFGHSMNVPGIFEKYASHFSRIFLWKVFDECENGVSMNRKFEKYIYYQKLSVPESSHNSSFPSIKKDTSNGAYSFEIHIPPKIWWRSWLRLG